MQSLEEQLPVKEGYQISGCFTFKFEDDRSEHSPCLKIEAPPEQSRCSIAMEPMAAMVKI